MVSSIEIMKYQFTAEIERYAAKRRADTNTMPLFDDEGNSAIKSKAQWNEKEHPRVAKGSTSEHGGQFTKKAETRSLKDSKPKAERSLESKLFGRHGKDVKILGGKIFDEVDTKGQASLIGRRVDSPEDLASIAQIYRDPRYETFRVFLEKDGMIVGHNAYTSRLPSVALVPPETIDQLKEDIKATGATGYYLLHNHPTGDPTPSRDDMRVTRSIASAVAGMKSHVIIDHTKGTILSPDGVPREYSLDNKDMASVDSAQIPHEYLGKTIDGPSAIASMAMNLRPESGRAVVIFCNARLQTRMLVDVDAKNLETVNFKIVAALRKAGRAVNSGRFFAILPENSHLPDYRKLIESGLFTDVVTSKGESAHSVAGHISQDPIESRIKAFHNVREVRKHEEKYSYLANINEIEIIQYARRRADLSTMSLFDDEGNSAIGKKWDEKLHPRAEAGSEHTPGGRFVKKEEAAGNSLGKPDSSRPLIQPQLLNAKKDAHDLKTESNGVKPEEIMSLVDNLAVDPSTIRGTHVLFEDEIVEPREINNRRIAARKRRQEIERQKAGLFAGEVASEQKDPRQELEESDARLRTRVTASDTGAREKWIENLKRLAQKTPQEQSKLVAAWNATETPKDHAYFAGWLSKAEKNGLAAKVTDRSDIADKEKRETVERMDRTWRTLKDIEHAANPESKFNVTAQRLSDELAKYKSLGVAPPDYKSDRPSWDDIQKKKQLEQNAKRQEMEEEKAKVAKSLLFPIDELKSAFEGISIGKPAAKPIKGFDDLPDSVKSHVKRHVQRINDANKEIELAKGLDKRFGGGGRYEDEVRAKFGKNVLEASTQKLQEFMGMAEKNGFDGKAIIEGLGGSVPEAEKPAPSSPLIIPETTVDNSKAKSGDQLGLFGEATKAKVADRPFVPTLLGNGETTKAKQHSMFETMGHPDQMNLFSDGSEPDGMVQKPKEDNEKPTLLDQKKLDHLTPIPFRDRKSFAQKMAVEGKSHSEIVDAMIARGVAAVDAKRNAAMAMGDVAQGVVAKPVELNSKPMELGPKDGDKDENGLVFRNGRWHRDDDSSSEPPKGFLTGKAKEDHLANLAAKAKAYEDKKAKLFGGTITDVTPDGYGPSSEPEATKQPEQQKELPPEEKPDPNPEAVIESKTASLGQKAFAAADEAKAKNESLRQVATAAQKQLDADYQFARSSDIRNAGQDLKGSARHKINEWKNLAEAEKDGTAERLVTRDNLFKAEPHNLVVHAGKNPLTALTMHYALRSFPAKPGTRKGGDAKKDREQYLEAYRSIKEKADEIASRETLSDPRKALNDLRDHVATLIFKYRGQKGNDSMARASATDPRNQTANDLVDLHGSLRTVRVGKTYPISRIEEFSREVKSKLGDIPSSSIDEKKAYMAKVTSHAQDIIEGKSLNKTFGNEAKKVRRFDPAEAYVKRAERKGGRDVSKVTSDPNKATGHMVDSMGLRGVQWGNTVTDDERKHHAGKALEALTDLTDVLGLHPKDISLDGKLGLAIGARGKGLAMAHYEPGSQVINLTRANGIGTLAHEWGHGFDHMLNGFTLSQKSENRSGGDYFSEDFERTHELHNPKQPGARVWKATETSEIVPSFLKEGYERRERPMLGVRKAYQEWHKASQPFLTRLKRQLREDVSNKIISRAQAENYWASGREVFARTFEQHVQHKLRDKGNENTYLAGLGNNGGYWPTKEESKAMAPAFDKIFEEYRKQKHGSPDVVKYSAREALEAWGPTLLGKSWESIDRYRNDYDDLRYDITAEDHRDAMRYSFARAMGVDIDRYEWNEAAHPRERAGSPIGGEFKSRGGNQGNSSPLAAKPGTRVEHGHHLHASNLPRDVQSSHRTILSNLHETLGFDWRHAKTDAEYQEAFSKVDKQRLQGVLEQFNQLDRDSRAKGIAYSDFVNAEQSIPQQLAIRLGGGARFFDQSQIADKLENAPEEYVPRESQAQHAEQIADELLKRISPDQWQLKHAGHDYQDNSSRTIPGPKGAFSTTQEATSKPGSRAKPEPTPKPEPDPVHEIAGISSQASNKLNREIAAMIGDDNPAMVADFRSIVEQAHRDLIQEAQEHNEALGVLSNGRSLGGDVGWARNTSGDYANKKNFDTAADEASKRWPHLFKGDDKENAAMELLRKGKRGLPKIYDQDVIDRAMSMAGSSFFEGYENYDPNAEPAENELESIPFSWRAAKVDIDLYRHRAWVTRYMNERQMSFNWDEQSHPRQPKGSESGGEFAKKTDGQQSESVAVAPAYRNRLEQFVSKGLSRETIEKHRERKRAERLDEIDRTLDPEALGKSNLDKEVAMEKAHLEAIRKAHKAYFDHDKSMYFDHPGYEGEETAMIARQEAESEAISESDDEDSLSKLKELSKQHKKERDELAEKYLRIHKQKGRELWKNVGQLEISQRKEMKELERTHQKQVKAVAKQREKALADLENEHEALISQADDFFNEREESLYSALGDFQNDAMIDRYKLLTFKELDKFAKNFESPTKSQAEAGNYRKAHINFQGLEIAIETPKGKRRRPEWPPMAAHYGDIKGTIGKDGDPIDVFVGPDLNSEIVYVIDQVDQDGKFDEHKALIGFRTHTDAVNCYKKCYTPSWRVGPVTTMTIDQFKNWLAEGNLKQKIGKQVSQYSAANRVERYFANAVQQHESVRASLTKALHEVLFAV